MEKSTKIALCLVIALLVLQLYCLAQTCSIQQKVLLLSDSHLRLSSEVADLRNLTHSYLSELHALSNELNSTSAHLNSLSSSLQELNNSLLELRHNYMYLEKNLTAYVDLYVSLHQNYTALKKMYDSLLDNYTSLLSEYKQLKEVEELRQSESHEYEQELSKQLSEVSYVRYFNVYDYARGKFIEVPLRISAIDYLGCRLNATRGQAIMEERVSEASDKFKQYVTYGDKYVKELAQSIRSISGDDDELYSNLVLQLVHQVTYSKTLYFKYPVEVLVENMGDCDNLAILAASILKAGGLEVSLLLCRASADGVTFAAHAMVGVALSAPPKVPELYGRAAQSVGYMGRSYYICECTFAQGRDPWDFRLIGTLVGDNPWRALEDVVVLPIE